MQSPGVSYDKMVDVYESFLSNVREFQDISALPTNIFFQNDQSDNNHWNLPYSWPLRVGPLSVAPGQNLGGLQVRSCLGVGFFFDLKFNSVLPCLILIGSLWPWVTHPIG